MTTKLTDHQLKMCALAGNVEIVDEDFAGLYIKTDKYSANHYTEHGWIRIWNPLSPEDSQNLHVDAEIDLEWQRNLDPKRSQVRASHYAMKFTVFSDWLQVSDYPTPAKAMRMAIALCAVAKGEVMRKENDDG